MGNFRLGAEQHAGAFVDQVKSNLDRLVGRHGLATKDLMAESCCLGLTHSGLGFFFVRFRYCRSTLRRGSHRRRRV